MKGIAVLAAVGLVSMGCAQSVFEEPTNIAFRLGYVYPIDANLRDAAPNYIGVGIDFFPTGWSLLKEGQTVVSFDWLGKSGSGAQGNVFPIMLNQRIYGDPPGVATFGRTYFQFGLGVAIIDVNSTDTVLAARVGMGKEFGEKIFGEVNFIYSEAGGGARATSLGFYVGYKF